MPLSSLPPFYYFANRALRRVIFPLLMPVTVRGREHVPPEGPLIVVINHVSIVEAPMCGAFFPRDVVMLSKSENFELPFFGHVVRNYGAIPITRGEGDIEAIKQALRVLQGGQALLVAPEGTRAPPPLREGREGAALLAVRAGAPIIPIGIAGQEHFSTNLRRLRPTPVTFSIGPAFRLESPSRRPTRAMLREMTTEIMERLAAELPPHYHGSYTPTRSAGTFAHPLTP